MILAGLIAACGFIFLILKFNLRRVLKHDILIDVLVTFFFIWIFAGTFAGMMAGLMAGAIISVFLYIAKRLIPQEKLGVVKTDKFPYRKFDWVPVNDEQ
jgi:presenilin-like A22 family membrane protease